MSTTRASLPTPFFAAVHPRLASTLCSCAIKGALLMYASNAIAESDPAAALVAEADGQSVRLAAASEADAAIATVVVDGQQGLSALRDAPQSISVISGEDLQRENALTLDAITKRLSNVKWNYGNSSTSSYSIRGVGKIGQNMAADPSVGIDVDDVAYAFNPLASFNFYDVDSVEVLRGPQGTAFGRNTTLGAIRVRTKRPTFERTAEYSLGYNIYEDQKYSQANGNFVASAAFGGPLVDDLLAYRAAFHVDRGGGYIANRYNPDNSYINSDRAAGRLQLLFTPSADFSALLSVDVHPRNQEYSNIGSTNFFNTPTPIAYGDGTPNPLTNDASTKLARRWFRQNGDYSYLADYLSRDYISSDSQQAVVTGTNGAKLELNWNIAADYTLTSITAFKDYYFNAFRDDEGTVFDVLTASGQNIRYEQLTQEIRLASYNGGLVDWQAGAHYTRAKNLAGGNTIHGGDSGAWNASNSQYAVLDADSNGRYLMENALNGLWLSSGLQDIEHESAAVFAQLEWHLSDPLTVTTGVRLTREDRKNTVRRFLVQQGYAPELNPVSIPHPLSGVAYEMGGFASNAAGELIAGQNSAEQLALADSVALEYFGVASYSDLTAEQRAQVAAAKAIRASQIGLQWDPVEAEPFDELLPTWVLSTSYRLSSNVTTYVSAQHGEKAGIPQVTNGLSDTTAEERSDSYEWGFKSTLLDNSLDLNVAIFQMKIENYQQAVRAFDAYTTALRNDGELYYTNATGNVPEVEVKGVEIDSLFTGIPNTTIRFSGAYNDAKYKRFPNSAQPPENGNLDDPFRDVSGYRLPGAAKITFDVGVEYRLPVFAGKELHTSASTFYTSKFNSDNALSSYGWIPAHSLTDFSIGLGDIESGFDVTVIVKNLFNDDTHRNRTWNAYAPAIPRWYGITLSGRL